MSEEFLSHLKNINLKNTAHSNVLVETVRYSLYDEKQSKQVFAFLNKLLASAVTRDKGFTVIYNILLDCSSDVLEENCVTWTNYAISHHPKEVVAGIRFKLIARLISLCHQNQDYHKYVVSTALQKIVEMILLVNIRTKETRYSLECLTKCMQIFSSTCITYKQKIEDYIMTCLNAQSSCFVVEEAAKCFHYLHQLGGAGQSGITHVKNFSDNFEKLYITLNCLYDTIFENIQEYNVNTSEIKFTFFKELSDVANPNELNQIYSTRLRNVTTFIIAALENNFPVKKTFNAEALLNVIRRGLAVHLHYTDVSEFSTMTFSTIIQEHQVDLLRVLKSLIICLKHNFVRFASIQLLLDYLNRTKNCSCFKSNREYQIMIYDVLKYWILNSGEQIDSNIYDKIIIIILDDITPVKKSLALNINITKVKKSKTKETEQESEIMLGVKNVNENVCSAALDVLELLLRKIPLNVKQSSVSMLYNVIVKTLIEICVKNYEAPYNNKNCRMKMFKVLIAIFHQTSCSLDPAIAVNILNLGLRINDNDIVNICSEGLNSLENICQPRHPSLYSNLDTNNQITQNDTTIYDESILMNGNDNMEVTIETNSENDLEMVEVDPKQTEVIEDKTDKIETNEVENGFKSSVDRTSVIIVEDDENVSNEASHLEETEIEPPLKLFKLDETTTMNDETTTNDETTMNDETTTMNDSIDKTNMSNDGLDSMLSSFVDEVKE